MYQHAQLLSRISQTVLNVIKSIPLLWIKTVTYCIMHFTVAIMVAFALTRDIRAALAIGVVEPLVQTFFFNRHEWVWRKIEAKRQESRARQKTAA